MGKTKIVILGAGYGGVHSAKLLNKKLKKNEEVEITIIDKNPYHTLLTELHEVAGNRVEPDGVQVDLRKIFNATKVKVVTDTFTKIDFEGRKVIGQRENYAYDYLVVGIGSETADFGVPGVKEHAFTLWSHTDAIKLKEHFEEMFIKASCEKDVELRRQLLTFIIAGAGFTGVEAAGELAEYKRQLCEEYFIAEKEVRIIIAEAMPDILPIMSQKMIKKAKSYLRRLNIEVMTNSPIVKIEENSITFKNNQTIKTRTLLWTCGVNGNSVSGDLGLKIAKRARIETNEFMQEVNHENIYIVGDIAYYEENDRPLPQIVETALQTAETATHNITADILKKEKKRHKSNYHGNMVSIGSHFCVAELSGVALTGFIAMMMKHLVNMHYLWGVGKFNAIWEYAMHEFFDVKRNRSFIGGHVAKKTPTFWIVILRVFIGSMWIYEAINKINTGWLDSAKIYASTAATSGATAVEGAGDATKAAVATVVPLLAHAPKPMQWIIDNFIAPHAVLFQTVIIGTELALGLALIAGLFTVLAALATMVLCVSFTLSAMADKTIFWYFFGAIALLGGAGRSFGLDYFIMPWLKKWWNKTLIARKTFLYIGDPNIRV
jgi:NADH:ubiquinone reductase (H+-translocating)